MLNKNIISCYRLREDELYVLIKTAVFPFKHVCSVNNVCSHVSVSYSVAANPFVQSYENRN